MKKIFLMTLWLLVLLVLAAAIPSTSEPQDQEDQKSEQILIARGGHGGGHHGGHHGGHRGGGHHHHRPIHPHYGCFIATAAYGDASHSHVQILREFRDKWLSDNQVGRIFLDFYYKNSLKAAQFLEKRSYLKPLVRAALLPIVGISWCLNSTKEGGKNEN